ncbi:MAG: hypothetical protein IKB71_11620 [Lentisphaeria bacterium]|nr:hypothetical protein [Lentisphaeria bacterium]
MSEAKIRAIDANLQVIKSGDGAILASPGLQGRILCTLNGELLHKLDYDLAENPSPTDFNNLGGNSLWPAPEGGAFAYNYPPGGDWYVQDDINRTPYVVESSDDSQITLTRNVNLLNRKGVNVKMQMYRHIEPLCVKDFKEKYGVEGVAYCTLEKFNMLADYTMDDVLIGAWSLEQFWLTPAAVSFGVFADEDITEKSLNVDFYGDPRPNLAYGKKVFAFRLGGANRLQIAVHKAPAPQWIGAYLPERDLLILRCNRMISEGTYFDIADNDQPRGPFTTEDTYSIFNGSEELNFFELETIAPMAVGDGKKVLGSALGSETYCFKGSREQLILLIKNHLGVDAIPGIF